MSTVPKILGALVLFCCLITLAVWTYTIQDDLADLTLRMDESRGTDGGVETGDPGTGDEGPVWDVPVRGDPPPGENNFEVVDENMAKCAREVGGATRVGRLVGSASVECFNLPSGKKANAVAFAWLASSNPSIQPQVDSTSWNGNGYEKPGVFDVRTARQRLAVRRDYVQELYHVLRVADDISNLPITVTKHSYTWATVWSVTGCFDLDGLIRAYSPTPLRVLVRVPDEVFDLIIENNPRVTVSGTASISNSKAYWDGSCEGALSWNFSQKTSTDTMYEEVSFEQTRSLYISFQTSLGTHDETIYALPLEKIRYEYRLFLTL
jgi:hypothetical protein